jgi:RNA 2',3'-cyclic 3'-phosphodiesterase
MRVFLAMEPPGAIKEYLMTVTKTMSQRVSGVKWVKAEGLHVTLKFFGETGEKEVQEIEEALQGINKKYLAMPLQLKEINAFPDLMRPRVIVVTFQEGVDNVKTIFHDIENRLLAVGIQKEKRGFAPHITIGRVKDTAPLLKRNLLPLEEKRFILDNLVLYQSTLTREGALYTPLKEIKLERNIE